jgi:hypothetical protein
MKKPTDEQIIEAIRVLKTVKVKNIKPYWITVK